MPESDEPYGMEVFRSNGGGACQRKTGPSSLDSILHPRSNNGQPDKPVTSSAPSSPTQISPEKVKIEVCEVRFCVFTGYSHGLARLCVHYFTFAI